MPDAGARSCPAGPRAGRTSGSPTRAGAFGVRRKGRVDADLAEPPGRGRGRPVAADAAGQIRRMPSAYFIIGAIVSAMAADAASGVIAPLPTAVMSSSTVWLILTPFWPGQANQGSARSICRALVAKLGLAS